MIKIFELLSKLGDDVKFDGEISVHEPQTGAVLTISWPEQAAAPVIPLDLPCNSEEETPEQMAARLKDEGWDAMMNFRGEAPKPRYGGEMNE